MYKEDSNERNNEFVTGTYRLNYIEESYSGYSYQAYKPTTTRTTRKSIKPRRIRSTTNLMGNATNYEVHTDPIHETKTSTELTSVSPPVTKTTSLSSDEPYLTTIKKANVTTTLNPVTTTPLTKPSTTETTTTEKYRKPSPILLTILPDSTEIIATEGEIPNLRCEVSGSNLPKLLPYVVSWYEREDGGNDVELNFEYNATTLAFNKTITGHDLNHEIYCSIRFNIMAPTVFGKMSTPYVPITRIKKPVAHLETNDTDNNLQNWIIGGAVGGVTLLVIIIVLVVLMIRCRTQRADTNNRTPEPPTQNSSSGVYETPEDPIYSYVPISVVTFYEAKAMAAANRKMEMQSVKPPPLPQRPPNMSRSDDYDYAYAVNNRRPPPPT
ncbi:uncharacterized protein LOC113233312 [Hyposmocoma kahamanoa]|uniref:uncharacterized protein LOC113233312 n=1 Tax=Hyposmocoma kahamanoa TaxID=1477025 RepID=UPI000E6D8778|nr:uncharacterized protein LOC113233312 [Hyposmocoma kahamanoa]